MQEPVYFHEHFSGILYRTDAQTGLVLADRMPSTPATIIHSGDLILRYGVDLLVSPHAFIPGYFETENGAVFTGEAAWDFIWAKFQLYPRAEVLGMRQDGLQTDYLMRDLDFGEGRKVLAYADESSPKSLGTIAQLRLADMNTCPPRLDEAFGNG